VERDSLLKAARRDSTEALGKQRNAACVNTHPTFGNLSDKPPLAKIATHHATPYLVSVIKAIDATQGGPPPEPSGAELVDDGELAESAAVADPLKSVEELSHNEGPVKSEILNPKSEVPLLTLEEKRRILARIARVNATDCFDESGNFDIARAKRVLPPGAVCSISIHETTCPTAEGQSMTERRIHLRLVDPVSALRLDDQLERRRERSASRSSSATDSDSPPPHPASPEYAHMLLRKNTIALDEANHTLAQLRKALAEKEDRRRRLSKELDEKDQQLSKTLSPSSGSQTLSKVEGEVAQRDTGCQPVQEELQTSPGCQPVASKSQNSSSQTLSNIEGDAAQGSSQALQSRDQLREAGFSTPLSEKSNAQNSSNPTLPDCDPSTQRDTGCQPGEPNYQSPPPNALSPVEGKAMRSVEGKSVRLSDDGRRALSTAKGQALRELKEIEAQQRNQEVEDAKNSMGPGAFARWFRNRQREWAQNRSQAPSTKHYTARPPPEADMSFAAQGMPKCV